MNYPKLNTLLVSALFLPFALLAGEPVADGEDDGPRSCAEKRAECVASCDSERTFFIFKGERYDSCVDRCAAKFPDDCPVGRSEDPRKDKDNGKDDGKDDDKGKKGEHGRGEMEHPQGKEYGYEKNADKQAEDADKDERAEQDEQESSEEAGGRGQEKGRAASRNAQRLAQERRGRGDENAEDKEAGDEEGEDEAASSEQEDGSEQEDD